MRIEQRVGKCVYIPPNERDIMAHVAIGWLTGPKLLLIQLPQLASDPWLASSGTALKPGWVSPVVKDLKQRETCSQKAAQARRKSLGETHERGDVWNARRVMRPTAIWADKSKSTANQLTLVVGFVKGFVDCAKVNNQSEH